MFRIEAAREAKGKGAIRLGFVERVFSALSEKPAERWQEVRFC